MRHDPAWLRLHDGRAHGVLADDPVHAHSGIEPSAGHTDQQNHHRPHSDAAQSHVDPARTDTSGSASLTRPNHPKAALPIDQRVGPAGSCTGGFRTQAPETLHNSSRSGAGAGMTACAETGVPHKFVSCRSVTRPFKSFKLKNDRPISGQSAYHRGLGQNCRSRGRMRQDSPFAEQSKNVCSKCPS